MQSKGYLISFEGQDACGKSTLVQELAKYFLANGYTVYTVDEFSQSIVGNYLRILLTQDKFLRFGQDVKSSFTETLFITADLYFQHEIEIMPRLRDQVIVLKDRHVDTIFACQIPKIVKDYPEIKYENLYDWVERKLSFITFPDLTFFLTLPLDIQIERIKSRGEAVSDSDIQIFKEREKIYRELASKYTDRIVVYENIKSIEMAVLEIGLIVKNHFYLV